MKNFYLVAEKDPYNGNFTVSVRDNAKGMEILKEFSAESYAEAVKKYSFSVSSMGKSAWCGVNTAGVPFHGEA